MPARPELGVSNPPRMLRRVVLPEPEAPTSAIISPGATSRSSPCKATTSRSSVLYILMRFSQVTRFFCMLFLHLAGDHKGHNNGRPQGSPLLVFVEPQCLAQRWT